MGVTGLSAEELEEVIEKIIENHTEPLWSIKLAWGIIGAGCLFMLCLMLKAAGVW